MKHSIKKLFFVGAIACSHALHAQVLTLDSVLAIIDRRNPMLQEYDQRTKALNEYAAGAKSWMAPMAGVGTFMMPYPGQKLEEGSRGNWMLSLEQEIPNPLKQNANRNYLQSKANVEKQSRSVQFNSLRSEAKAYYYQWIVAEKRKRVLTESEQIVRLMIRLAQIRYPYNQSAVGSIYKAEGRLSEVLNEQLMVQAEIADVDARLKSLMNIPATDSIAIDTTVVIDFQTGQLALDTTSLSTRRSDIQRINQTIEVMRLNQVYQKYQAKPDFKVRFDHMQPIGNMPVQFTAMAMISIPVVPWASRMYKAAVSGMQYDIAAMQKNREAVLNEARGMLVAMSRQLSSMKVQLSNYEKKIIPALRRNYQTSMIAYEENREQLPVVIDGWEALSMAQLEYLEKVNDYYQMIIRYERELEK